MQSNELLYVVRLSVSFSFLFLLSLFFLFLCHCEGFCVVFFALFICLILFFDGIDAVLYTGWEEVLCFVARVSTHSHVFNSKFHCSAFSNREAVQSD